MLKSSESSNHSNPFRDVTKVAIEEIVTEFIEPSKFGYFLSEMDRKLLVDELLKFIETSRSLKSRGDRLLADGPAKPSSGRLR